MNTWRIAVAFLLMAVCAFAQAPAPASLEDLERIAIENHPVLVQAEARIRAAEGRTRQAGAYPNPFVGVTNDDLSYGPVIRGGEWGVVVEQDIVLGGKLGISRNAAAQGVVREQALAEAARLRVLNHVRALFYQALAVQKKMEVRQHLLTLVQEAVTTSRQLQNVGQADLPDVLEIEIEEQSADLALLSAQNELRQISRQLAAAIGQPQQSIGPLTGDIEAIPQLDHDEMLSRLLAGSPEIRMARAAAAQNELLLEGARREPVPDLNVRAGVHYNRELLESGGRPIGVQGSIEVGMRVPLFNRNQGGIEAASADLSSAQREVDRVELSIRSRLAGTFREYQDLKELVQRYRDQMLPRASRAYDLYLAGFRQMAAAYPQALIAQRTLLQLQEEYDEALANLWRKVVDIQGMLLTTE